MTPKFVPMAVLTAMNVGVWVFTIVLGSLFLMGFAGVFTMLSGGFALRLMAI